MKEQLSLIEIIIRKKALEKANKEFSIISNMILSKPELMETLKSFSVFYNDESKKEPLSTLLVDPYSNRKKELIELLTEKYMASETEKFVSSVFSLIPGIKNIEDDNRY